MLRYRAERLMRKDFEGLKPRVLATVRARLGASGASLDAADLDACYSTAWHALYAALAGGKQIDDVTAWLVLVTFRRAIDEWRASGRRQALGQAHAGTVAPRLGGDFASELDDRERLRQLMEGLVARLNPRERRAATLCYLHGFTRAQAARRMGVSEARMRKLMDGTAARPGVAAKVGEVLASVGAGEWCEQQGSLMRAHALGILAPDGERGALAREHLRHCPGCRAMVLMLRGLAALLPPLAPPSVLFAPREGRPPKSHERRPAMPREGRPPMSREGRPAMPHERRPAMSREGRPPMLHRRRGGRLVRVHVAPRLRVPALVTRAGGSLVPKIAVASVAVLGAGGGYALLAHGVSSHARAASHATREISLGAASPPRTIGRPVHSPPALRRPRARPPAKLRNPRRPGGSGPHAATAGGSALAPSGSAPATVTHGAGSNDSSNPSPSASGEFTPERVGGGRRGG